MNDKLPDLITLDEVADMARQPLHHTRRVLVHSPDFPKPAPGSTPRRRRWRRREVEDYLLGSRL